MLFIGVSILQEEVSYKLMEAKKKILFQSKEIIREIQTACNDFGLDSLKKTSQSVEKFTEQSQYLDIAVLGQFKAGKSSFLNGYLNNILLPVGNIPVTSIITRIKFGLEEKVIVIFKNRTSKIISTDKITEYVSELENPENEKNVLLVDLELPSLSDIKQIRLVDTPGIGSVWKHNTETTIDWFPETGGVLFIISAEKPISEHELNLLKEISFFSTEIAIVITKTDLFKEEQINEIELFTKKVLKQYFDRDFPIYRYSTYKNTSVYNKEIEEFFFLPLAQNRDKTHVKILYHKISTLINTCLSYLDISYQVSLKKESEREKLKEIILDAHLNSQYIRRELLLIITSYKEKTRENFETYLKSYRGGIEKKLLKDFQLVFPCWKGNLYQLTRQFEKWLKQSLETELKEILLQEEKSFELLNNVKTHLSFYLKSFRERLSNNVEVVLGVKIKPEEWEIALREMKRPNISISRTFDFHLDMFWFLFPMFIYKRFFGQYFLRLIPCEVEKNIYRSTSNLTEITNKEMDILMTQAVAYTNEELKTIEMLLLENKKDSQHIFERIDNIRNKFKVFVGSINNFV